MLKRFTVLAVASAAIGFAAPAVAEEIGVGVGPVGVTVGSGPDRVVHEREVVREREPRERVIIKRDRAPDVVEKRTTIIKRD